MFGFSLTKLSNQPNLTTKTWLFYKITNSFEFERSQSYILVTFGLVAELGAVLFQVIVHLCTIHNVQFLRIKIVTNSRAIRLVKRLINTRTLMLKWNKRSVLFCLLFASLDRVIFMCVSQSTSFHIELRYDDGTRKTKNANLFPWTLFSVTHI